MSAAARLALMGLVVLTGCGSGGDDRTPRFDPFTEVREGAAGETPRAGPRWEAVAMLSGSGAAREEFAVARGAIQWRARWRCETGRLRLSGPAGPLTDTSCPRRGESTGVRTGALELDVQASGRWRIRIEQQVDTPLREPPLDAMRSPRAQVVARGSFYDLERPGRGTASLYRLAGGRLALRFDGFATSANTDLYVWLSTARRPRNSVQAARAEHTVLRELKSTLGEQNYLLPRGTAERDIRSVVIWCDPVRIAYTAAALRAGRRTPRSG